MVEKTTEQHRGWDTRIGSRDFLACPNHDSLGVLAWSLQVSLLGLQICEWMENLHSQAAIGSIMQLDAETLVNQLGAA